MSASSPTKNGTTMSEMPSGAVKSQSVTVIIAAAVLTGASTIIFGLRLFTRTFILKTAGLDDWTMLVAQILAIVTGIATIIEAHAGLGRHVETLSAEQIRVTLVALYLVIFAYNLGLNVVKMSFLLQYRRIFPSSMLQRVCMWTLGFVAIWTIGQQVLLSLSCVPLASLEPSTASWCLNTLPVWEFTSIVSLLTDVLIFAIPLPCIWELPIPWRQKALLCGIFGLGFFVVVISIIRVPTLHAAASAQDPTFDNVGAALWTMGEFNAAIICSSLPILRPLFFRAAGHVSYAKKSSTSGADVAKSYAYKMQDLDKNKVTTRSVGMGPTDSSEDLVTATMDEMMYRSRSIASVRDAADLKSLESGSVHTTALNEVNMFESGRIDPGLSPKPR